MENINNLHKNIGSKSREAVEIEKRIKDAFIILYEDRPIEKISIKMITDLAGLNRGTFYLHFIDIYDLREQIETEFYELIKDKVQGAVKELLRNGNLKNALPSIDFYKEHIKYLKVLLCTYGKSNLEEMMKQEIKQVIRNRIHIDKEHENATTEYALEYLTSAQLGVIIHWIRQDMQLPIESLSNFMTDITSMGSVPYLRRSVNLAEQK